MTSYPFWLCYLCCPSRTQTWSCLCIRGTRATQTSNGCQSTRLCLSLAGLWCAQSRNWETQCYLYLHWRSNSSSPYCSYSNRVNTQLLVISLFRSRNSLPKLSAPTIWKRAGSFCSRCNCLPIYNDDRNLLCISRIVCNGSCFWKQKIHKKDNISVLQVWYSTLEYIFWLFWIWSLKNPWGRFSSQECRIRSRKSTWWN